MNTPEPAQFINQLNDCRERAEKALEGVEPDAIIFAETDTTQAWTVKDLIGHITVWEEELLKSWQAHLEGQTYVVEGDEDAFNNQQVTLRKGIPYAQVLGAWRETRSKIVDAIVQMTPEQLIEEWTLAWHERGTASTVVAGLVWHENLHINDIVKGTTGSNN